jgi:lipopolysaccharide export system permease protein
VLKQLDKYILKNFLLTFVVLLGAFSAIAIVIDLTEKIKDFVGNKVPLLQIMTYFKNFLPFILALLFPIFIFVAVIFFTSKMANRSEIIAMLNSGMSFSRFLRPYVIGAGIISAVLMFANHFVIPKANKSRLKFEEKYLWEKKYSKDDNFHIRISPTEYMYMQSYNPESKTGFRFSYEKVIGTRIIEKVMADRCEYDSVLMLWKMTDVKIRINDSIAETLTLKPTLNRKFKFTPNDLIEKREAKQMMTTPELNGFMKKENDKGSENLNEYYIEKYRRTASPFSAFILSIIGACIASRKVRGGSGIHLAIGLMISAVYIFMMQFSTTFATKGNLTPMLAVWIPNIIFGSIALVIYRRYSTR